MQLTNISKYSNTLLEFLPKLITNESTRKFGTTTGIDSAWAEYTDTHDDLSGSMSV